MKRLLPVAALSILTLAGCANTAPYSGDVYRGNQAQTGQSVSYGTIVAVRPVQIQADSRTGNLLGGGGGAYFAGLFDSSPGAKGPTRIAVIDLGESVMHEFPQIKADLKTGKCRSPLLRTTFILLMRSTDLKRVQAMELRITDAIRSYLRDRERSDLVGRKSEERMRFETTQIINDLIAPSKIQGILFKEFVLQ